MWLIITRWCIDMFSSVLVICACIIGIVAVFGMVTE